MKKSEVDAIIRAYNELASSKKSNHKSFFSPDGYCVELSKEAYGVLEPFFFMWANIGLTKNDFAMNYELGIFNSFEKLKFADDSERVFLIFADCSDFLFQLSLLRHIVEHIASPIYRTVKYSSIKNLLEPKERTETE